MDRLWHGCIVPLVGFGAIIGTLVPIPAFAQTPIQISPGVSVIPNAAQPATLPAQNPAAPAAPAAAPAAQIVSPVASGEPAAGCADCGAFDWSKSKYHVQKFFWPIGYPGIPPTGPGYYSLKDQLLGNCQEKPPTPGYARNFAQPQGFFDVNFSYIDKKSDPTFLEKMHRIHLGDDWLFGTGGEYRLRYNSENNSRLTGVRNDYELSRLRIFGDLWYQDKFRAYVEYIDASSFNQNLRPALNDRNWGDLLNAFIEVKTLNIDDENVYARIGRQQMLLGSQRMISPLDWANAMRTFDGVRMYRRSEKFDVDAFWMKPVIPNANHFDAPDQRQDFAGLYTTYRFKPDQILDLYYLYLGNNDVKGTGKANGVGALQLTPYDYHTVGARLAGKTNTILSRNEKNEFLWDFENMYQMGSRGSGDISAGNSSSGVGYHFGDAPMNPTFWMYYDYASGSRSIQGTNTFNQYYPLGHYYLGWLDYAGRSNVEDLNFHMYLYPSKWITFNAQYHLFQLANAKDALYNTSSGVLRSDPTGRAGRDVGSELDLIVNWHLSPTTDIVTAYGHMFAGDFLRATGPSGNLNSFWLIYNVRW